MQQRFVLLRPCMVLLSYPLSWPVIALVGATHWGFSWWFQPSPALQGFAALIDVGALLAWGVMAWRSEALRRRYARLPYETSLRQVRRTLAACPAVFAAPAQQCLALLQHIEQEFTETSSRHELDALVANMAQLAQAYQTLYQRAQRFGTPEQKSQMTALLHKHLASVDHTLKTLQAFGGNLTLLSASVVSDEHAIQELRFLNQGLQDVLQEFHDAQP